MSKPLDEARKEALNLFEKDEKPKRVAGPVEEGSAFAHLGTKTPAKKKPATLLEMPPAPPKPVAMDLIGAGEPEPEAVAVPEAPIVDPIVEAEADLVPSEPGEERIIHLKPPIVVKDLAAAMDLKPFKLIQDLMELDVFASQNQAIEPDVAARVCEKHGFVFEKEKRKEGGGVHKVEVVIEEPVVPEVVEEEKLKTRIPVVTFMGHVDHGKTSLMDAFRGSRVTSGEAGGITQHIGAYVVERGEHKVTFIDTPGHQAFAQMRARGANITDIVVLVIAADDGIMPTTIEAIEHARKAGVSIVVAINKVDLERANLMRVMSQLQERDLAPEAWGGSTLCVEVSAKTGQGLDELFEAIVLQAEILELKADPTAPARGIVIESRTEAGRGPNATILVQTGTLKPGTPFICGNYYGKVKAMLDDRGKPIKEAGPSMPVEVLGFSDVPHVGDELVQMDTERNAKKLSEERLESERKEKLRPKEQASLENFYDRWEQDAKKSLKIILKTDVRGSAEAIVTALNEIKSDKVLLEVVRADAGPITETDVLFASASEAFLIGFNTKVENNAVAVLRREGITVKLYSIIYELLDQVKEAMLGLLDPETRERIIGHAVVKEVFKLTGGRVGGCMVTDGRVHRKARARVLRNGTPVYDGGFQTLRRFKEDVEEVRNGLECGIRLGDFNDYLKDDIIECYEIDKFAQTL